MMPRTEYVRISISLPLAEALIGKMREISPHLTIKEIVIQACMEYLENRQGINRDTSPDVPKGGVASKKSSVDTTEPTLNKLDEDIFRFDNFLED